MSRQVAVVLYVVAMAAVIVGVDFVFFRDRFWERLAVNAGIVLVFGAVPVTVKIAGNRIFKNDFGIWLGTGGNISAKIRHNLFFNVGTPVFTQP